jgi:hypothetical protein
MSKQFNLVGDNGLYLDYKPEVTLDVNNFKDELIYDLDFFPKNITEKDNFIFKNSGYIEPMGFIGSNSTQKSNSNLKYSEIENKNALVLNKTYYNSFDFYFRYYNSTISGYKLPNLTVAQTRGVLRNLRVRLYVQIGANLVPLKLTNLLNWDNDDGIYKIQNPLDPNFITICNTGQGNVTLTTDEKLDLKYSAGSDCDNWNNYKNAPNLYNFKVTASFPDFNQKSGNGKTYKIIVKYFNIGVSGASAPYNEDETVELMSNTFTYFLGEFPEELGGGGGGGS